MTMELIQTSTLGTAAASIEFTSIPQTFTDLVVLSSCRTDRAAPNTQESLKFTFNSVTTDYSLRRLFGNGSTVTSNTSTEFVGGLAAATSATANTFSNSICYIPNYTSATNKTGSVDLLSENNGISAFIIISANLWSNTAAITSILVEGSAGGTLQVGSTISLYGITKGSDGIVTTS
jgi:hypothetical protein